MTGIIIKVLLAGLPLAAVAAMLGSLLQWRSMSFAGDTLAHSSLLGIGLSLLLGVSWHIGVFSVAILLALYLFISQRGERLGADAALAVSAHATLAAGACLLFLQRSSVDWETILFGNILTMSMREVLMLMAASAAVLIGGALLWRRLVLLALNAEIANVETSRMPLLELFFLLLLALYITIGVRVVGVLLLNAMLVIPAAAARPLARSPSGMAVMAALIGMLSLIGGTALSFAADLPVAPATALLASVGCVLSWTWSLLRRAAG